MSLGANSKCQLMNESNIPLPKRISNRKKLIGCNKLPEYIESIVKATKQETLSSFNSKKKCSKSEKCLNNQQAQNKIECMKIEIPKNKTKLKQSDVNGNWPKISEKAIREQNCKTILTEENKMYLNSSLEIEKFLKKLYPNPYDLDKVNEFQNAKSDQILEKEFTADSGLLDVTVSKVNFDQTENNVVNTSTDDVFITADMEVNQNIFQENNKSLLCSPVDSEHCILSFSLKDNNSENDECIKNSDVPSCDFVKTIDGRLESSSTINLSSRPSSEESDSFAALKTINPPKLQENVENETGDINNTKKMIKRSKSQEPGDEDYDLGKLKLLIKSSSEDVVETHHCQNATENGWIREESDEGNLDFCKKQAFELKDFDDLCQIYDIMDKATESFLIISSRTKASSTEINKEPVQSLNKTHLENAIEFNQKNKILKNQCRSISRESFTTLNQNEKSEEKSKHEETSLGRKPRKRCYRKKVLTKERKKSEEIVRTKNTLLLSNSDYSKTAEDHNKKLNSQDELKTKQKRFEGELLETSQKIDEVLEFMYDCIMKFSKNGKNVKEKFDCAENEEKKVNKEDLDDIATTKNFIPIVSNSSATTINSTNILMENKSNEEMWSTNSSESGQSSKKLRNKRRLNPLEHSSPNCPAVEREVHSTRITLTNDTEINRNSFHSESREMNVVLEPVTVESQNELGGYTEEAVVFSSGNLRCSKTVLPLSVKIRKNNTDTCNVIKNALETEEKLLAGVKLNKSTQDVSSERGNLHLSNVTKPLHDMMLHSATNQSCSYSLMGGFRKQNSKFFICLNPLSHTLPFRNYPKIQFPSSLSISVRNGESPKKVNFDQFKNPKFRVKKIRLAAESPQQTFSCRYGFKEEIAKIVSRSSIAYTSKTVCLLLTLGVSKSEKIPSCKKLEYCVRKKPTPITTSAVAMELSPICNAVSLQSFDIQKYCDGRGNSCISEEKPVQALEEAVEEAEEKILLLEHNELGENSQKITKSISNSSAIDPLINYDQEWTEEKNRQKVQDLLLRTYNLQNKLHRYLHKMTCVRTTSLPCPSTYEETFLDLELLQRDQTDPKVFSFTDKNKGIEDSHSLVFWYLPTSVETEELPQNTNSVERVNAETPCPAHNNKAEANDNTSDFNVEVENDDDSSSTYSFKSSKDFSEFSDETEKKSNKTNKFLKKILNEIDNFRKCITKNKEKLQKDNKVGEDPKEKELVDYYYKDPKISTKFLRTTFKGKESITELSLGLKDVPMTNVSNILVEKKKFSENHTQISINISKDKPECNEIESKNPCLKMQDFPEKHSSFFFETVRPSPSTDFSKLEGEASKITEGYITDSEEDEDYKSVLSTFSNSEAEEKDKENNSLKVIKKSSKKKVSRHQFDFYKKMDLDLDFQSSKTKQDLSSNSMCKYKELEPLQQALTEMQIRMRNIKRHSFYNSNEYYRRALKLAKMSAGFCQSCGNRAVIPDDTFGYYRNLLSRKYSTHSTCYFNSHSTPHSSFYSICASNTELGGINLNKSSSYLCKNKNHMTRGVFRSSFNDLPVFWQRA